MSLTVLASANCSSAQQIASATAGGDLGIIGVINSINVKLGYEPISYALRYPLFENYQLTSVGQTFVANAQNDSHFLAFVQALTDGAVQSVGVDADPGAFYGQPEATFFDPLPAGNNGIDLQGYAISSVTMTVDSLTFERFIGGTYYTYRVTFRVYGVPRPKLVISPTGSSCSISWSPAIPDFILQETTSLSPANWTNSISGSTNPINVPITTPAKFYRLLKL